MATIEETVEVGVPVRTAYDQWTQFEEFPRFMEEVREVRQIDDTHLHWVAEVAGRDAEWDAEILEQEPDRRIAWRSTAGAQNDGVVHFESLDDASTRIRVEISHETENMAERAGIALGLAQRRVRRNMERFKDLVESRGEAAGAWRGEVQDGDPAAEATPKTDRQPVGPVLAGDNEAIHLTPMSSLRGMTVRNDGERIGRVREVYLDPSTRTARYIGVTTGWLARGQHVIPFDDVAYVNEGGEAEIVVPYSTEHIREAPALDDDVVLTPTREAEITGHYANAEDADARRAAVRARQSTPAPTPQIAEATTPRTDD